MQISTAQPSWAQPLRNAAQGMLALSERLPWAGWIGWLIFVAAALLRTTPRRFDNTFGVYLDTAHHFWAHQPLYVFIDPVGKFIDLGGFLYWPVSAVVLSPFLLVSPTVGAIVGQVLSAMVVSWGSIALMRELARGETRLPDPVVAAGYLLLINIPAAWYNFKGVQSAIVMTGAMMFAAAAMMRGRWNAASTWLFVAAIFKPLAIVMMLLCGAVERHMRLPLACAIAAALLLPFLFADPAYVASQYRAWIEKMVQVGDVLPEDWPYQVDFTTLFASFGLVVPQNAATVIRAIAALGTLGLALRIARTGSKPALGLGILLLTGCYVTLFGPRNEYLSFYLLTMPLAGLALLMLVRDVQDYRGWLLVAAALVLGFYWGWDIAVDRVMKPIIVIALFVWFTRLMLAPYRWRALVGDQ
jgi:hypothetical protein